MEIERVEFARPVRVERIRAPEVRQAMRSWFDASKHKTFEVMQAEWNEIFGPEEDFHGEVWCSFAHERLALLQRYTIDLPRTFSREALERLIPAYPAADTLGMRCYDKQGMIDGILTDGKTWQQILKDIGAKHKPRKKQV